MMAMFADGRERDRHNRQRRANFRAKPRFVDKLVRGHGGDISVTAVARSAD
jgi:hypothetical protein